MITQITVTYGLTHNLGNYSDVRPEVSLTSAVSPYENIEHIVKEMESFAVSRVQALVDDALESHKQSAYYSLETRYDLFTNPKERMLVVTRSCETSQFKAFYRELSGFRLESLERLIERDFAEYTRISPEECRQLHRFKD